MSKQAQLKAEFDGRKAEIEARYVMLGKSADNAHQIIMDALSSEMGKELDALECEYWSPNPRVEEMATIATPPGMPA